MDIKNVLSDEEAKIPVTYGDLAIFLEATLEPLIAAENQTSKIQCDTIVNLIDAVAESAAKIEYKRLRDVYYFINLISELNHIPKDVLLKNYHQYCDEFDSLNKHDEE